MNFFYCIKVNKINSGFNRALCIVNHIGCGIRDWSDKGFNRALCIVNKNDKGGKTKYGRVLIEHYVL